MEKELLINDFAIRSFRDTADRDYIAARMGYRTKLVQQFLWSGLQAIEKYLKCILLLNRIEARNINHDLAAAWRIIKTHAPFEMRLHETSRKLIEHLDTYGRFRYLETPFFIIGMELPQLDFAVWEVRRYCRPLNYELHGKSMLAVHIKEIEDSEGKPHHKFQISGGLLERILADMKHPAREALLWNNLFFGTRRRKNIKWRRHIHATNSPLSLHPEILDDVLQLVHLPRDVRNHYREELKRLSEAAASPAS
jgi:hypothetical protein